MKLIDLMEVQKIKSGLDGFTWLKSCVSSITAPLDSETFAYKVLSECGMLETRFNDSAVFKTMSTAFFASHDTQIRHYLNALFENYDVYEEYRGNENKSGTSDKVGRVDTDTTRKEDYTKKTITDEDTSGKETTNETINSNNSSTDEYKDYHNVSADNESIYQPRTEDTHNGTDSSASTSTRESETNSKGELDREVNETKGLTGSGTLDTDTTENVQTKATMNKAGHFKSNPLLAMDEMKVAVFNLYDIILALYLDEMFIALY